MKKLSLTLIFLASVLLSGAQNLNETFSSGDFLYTIIDNDPPSVSLDGFIDTANAQGPLVIPETVTFGEIDYTVTAIGDCVFSFCSGLTGNLELPSTIKRIGSSAFKCCSGLKGILVMPDSLEVIGNYAFLGCSGFTALVLNNGLREIGEGAFGLCENLSGTLVFPETVKHIYQAAFCRCRGFSGDLVIPNSVVGLGLTNDWYMDLTCFFPQTELCTFEDCFDHVKLSQSLDTIGPCTFFNCSKLSGDLVIPNSVKKIGSYAFSYCSGIDNLTLGDSLKNIDCKAFMGCSGIVGPLKLPEDVSVGFGVFINCEGLTEVEIPEGGTEISGHLFSHCTNLQKVHLPKSLKKISQGSFESCYSLEEINIPDSVTQIECGAFSKCTSLGELIIPDLVEEIVPYTFDSCVNLKRLVLGDSIKRIEDDAFVNCSLKLLELKPLTPPQYHFIYGRECLPDDLFILVPCGTLEAYQSDESWKRFTHIIADCGGDYLGFLGFEWYYEITNDDGTITYQHLEYVADTTINNKEVKIIIRNNTLYDKTRKNVYDVTTREYLYEENNVVYWWNPTLRQFTVLYDFNANVGDEWEIKVGTESVVMHVDAVDQYYHDGNIKKMLKVSDSENLFSGTIIQGIGHLTSFFPEKLMNPGKAYRVEGIRCFWQQGELVFKYGEKDCEEVYEQYHNDIDETTTDAFQIYPNPTDGMMTLSGSPSIEYRITNKLGQSLMTGQMTGENQSINVSNLPQGMYFITVGNATQKFVVR